MERREIGGVFQKMFNFYEGVADLMFGSTSSGLFRTARSGEGFKRPRLPGMGAREQFTYGSDIAMRNLGREPEFTALADKRQRIEIDDSAMRLRPSVLKPWARGKGGSAVRVPLRELVDHEELFRAYEGTGLAEMPVNVSVHPSNERKAQLRNGFGLPGQATGAKAPYINVEATSLEDARSLLLHEIQHAIQYLEGTAQGF